MSPVVQAMYVPMVYPNTDNNTPTGAREGSNADATIGAVAAPVRNNYHHTEQKVKYTTAVSYGYRKQRLSDMCVQISARSPRAISLCFREWCDSSPWLDFHSSLSPFLFPTDQTSRPD